MKRVSSACFRRFKKYSARGFSSFLELFFLDSCAFKAFFAPSATSNSPSVSVFSSRGSATTAGNCCAAVTVSAGTSTPPRSFSSATSSSPTSNVKSSTPSSSIIATSPTSPASPTLVPSSSPVSPIIALQAAASSSSTVTVVFLTSDVALSNAR